PVPRGGAGTVGVSGGPAGLRAGDAPGRLLIERRGVQPATELALAEKVRRKGAAFVECPVGGSTGPARQGQLIGLLGAEPADAARVEPLLRQMCRRFEHSGPVGAASPIKPPLHLPLLASF